MGHRAKRDFSGHPRVGGDPGCCTIPYNLIEQRFVSIRRKSNALQQKIKRNIFICSYKHNNRLCLKFVLKRIKKAWIPACAGMTRTGELALFTCFLNFGSQILAKSSILKPKARLDGRQNAQMIRKKS